MSRGIAVFWHWLFTTFIQKIVIFFFQDTPEIDTVIGSQAAFLIQALLLSIGGSGHAPMPRPDCGFRATAPIADTASADSEGARCTDRGSKISRIVPAANGVRESESRNPESLGYRTHVLDCIKSSSAPCSAAPSLCPFYGKMRQNLLIKCMPWSSFRNVCKVSIQR